MRKALFSLVNGVWSGIPLCCIWFFIKTESRINGVAYVVASLRGATGRAGVGYVRCDRCYRQNRQATLRGNKIIGYWLIEGR